MANVPPSARDTWRLVTPLHCRRPRLGAARSDGHHDDEGARAARPRQRSDRADAPPRPARRRRSRRSTCRRRWRRRRSRRRTSRSLSSSRRARWRGTSSGSLTRCSGATSHPSRPPASAPPPHAAAARACGDCPTRAARSASPARMECTGTALLTVRHAAQANMALHTRQELRLARGPRHQKLHLLLHWPDRHPTLQVRVSPRRRRGGAQPGAA